MFGVQELVEEVSMNAVAGLGHLASIHVHIHTCIQCTYTCTRMPKTDTFIGWRDKVKKDMESLSVFNLRRRWYYV